MKRKHIWNNLVSAVIIGCFLAQCITVNAQEKKAIYEEASEELKSITMDAGQMEEFLREDRENIEKYQKENKIELSNDLKISNNFAVNSGNAVNATSSGLLTRVDLSVSKYFPAIRNQGNLGSCTAFAAAYYMYTYEMNRFQDISSKTLSNCYSPAYVYNDTLQYGAGKQVYGSTLDTVLWFLKRRGCVKWNDMPYSDDIASCNNVCKNIPAMTEALNIRVENYLEFFAGDKQTELSASEFNDSMYKTKLLLNSGKLIVVSLGAFQYAGTSSNEQIIVRQYEDEGGHAIAVVGYDDTIWCDVNNNGIKDNGEVGAFKLANSWGSDRHNNGYVWLLYDALRAKTVINGSWEAAYGSQNKNRVVYNMAYAMNVNKKDVNLIARYDVKVPKRNEINIQPIEGDNTISYKNYGMPNSFEGTIVLDYEKFADESRELIGSKTWKSWLIMKYNSVNGSISISNSHFDKAEFILMDNKNHIIKRTGNVYNFKSSSFSNTTYFNYGDVNYDGNITQSDAKFVLQIALNLNSDVSNLQKLLSDYNRDGKIDMTDANLIQKKALGM